MMLSDLPGGTFVAIDLGQTHRVAVRSDGYLHAYGGTGFYGQSNVDAANGQVVPSPVVERYSYDVYGKPTIKAPNGSTRSVSTSGNRFVFAGVINFWDLRILECEVGGTILQTLELNREVGAGGIHVDYLAGKIFVAFATKLKENEREAKIALLALKPYGVN